MAPPCGNVGRGYPRRRRLYSRDASRIVVVVKIPGIFGAEGDGRPEVEAQKKMREGEFLAAGKLFQAANNLARAAEAYVQGKEFLLAAELYDRMGKREAAADCYVRGGDHKKAADALGRAGRDDKA